MKNVNVFGQTMRSWSSKYPDAAVTASEMLKDVHHIPTYMVESDKALISRFHRIVGIGNSSYPMAIYQNGQFLRQQQQKYR